MMECKEIRIIVAHFVEIVMGEIIGKLLLTALLKLVSSIWLEWHAVSV